MARYHGFTCPDCGSHYFGTHTHHRAMGEKYEHGTKVGKCNAHQHTGNGCAFEWNRDDPEAEAIAMYKQTPEEWMASFREDMRPNVEHNRRPQGVRVDGWVGRHEEKEKGMASVYVMTEPPTDIDYSLVDGRVRRFVLFGQKMYDEDDGTSIDGWRDRLVEFARIQGLDIDKDGHALHAFVYKMQDDGLLPNAKVSGAGTASAGLPG